ncbi:hypothetical protein EJB05_41940, partial [Eragrostis curvula]
MGDQAIAYVPHPDEPEVIGARVHQRRFLEAGRILVTGGWLVLTHVADSDRAANAEHGLVGLIILLLGVSLIVMSLSPVANRFPGAARVGAAVAYVVIFYFFTPAGN